MSVGPAGGFGSAEFNTQDWAFMDEDGTDRAESFLEVNAARIYRIRAEIAQEARDEARLNGEIDSEEDLDSGWKIIGDPNLTEEIFIARELLESRLEKK